MSVHESSPRLSQGTPPEWLDRARAASCPTGIYNDRTGGCVSDAVTDRMNREGVYKLPACAALAIKDSGGGEHVEYRCWLDGPKQEVLVESSVYGSTGGGSNVSVTVKKTGMPWWGWALIGAAAGGTAYVVLKKKDET
jgi:hypothetical protein